MKFPTIIAALVMAGCELKMGVHIDSRPNQAPTPEMQVQIERRKEAERLGYEFMAYYDGEGDEWGGVYAKKGGVVYKLRFEDNRWEVMNVEKVY